jgi:hypothetical protein
MSDDPVAFLKARYDEDEELARQALETGTAPMWDPASNVFLMPGLRNRRRLAAQGVEGALDGAVEAHIARHDPARVLREIEAKQELLSRYEAMESGVLVLIGVESILSEYRRVILPQLALPYADRPDYRDEWRP